MGSAMAQTGLDFPKPKGLLPGGQSDSRFPVSFAAPVTEGLRLVIEYFTALNQRDVAGIAKTLHFPFAIYENIEPLRSEERRVGKECVSKCRSRWSPSH